VSGRPALGALLALAVLGGCGGGGSSRSGATALPPSVVPTPIGVGTGYRLPPGARPVGGLRCSTRADRRFGVHLELFARRRVLIVPAGIGQRAPLRRRGRRLVGVCSFPLRTAEPTGVAEIAVGARPLTLADLFRVWGQPLSGRRLAGFRGPVAAWVGGRRWPGAVGAIPLARHAEIVVEVDGHVPPHPSYLFPTGL
jgi:hypothetical protein